MPPRFIIALLSLSVLSFSQQHDEFFEKKIRPVLVAKCQGCHNAKVKMGGIDMSSAAAFASSGAAARLEHVLSYDERIKMPPTGKLPADEIANIAAWVKLGAPWPGAPAAAVAKERAWSPEQTSFWAFQPVRKVQPPAVKNESWVRSPIDRFILAQLEAKNLKPAPEAARLTLLRRATFDLTGLPPTEDEIAAFLADTSPKAFDRVVDRLLDSPRYGERWGRHWLDVARYADSTGNDEDHRYPYAWRYRDYVIDAFNRDLPFNQFVREQIAGDLLPPRDGEVNRDGIVATGFLALGAKALAQQDKQKMLYDVYDEQVDVTTKAFLGLTVACARCHDHKFDPIATKDYYALTGIFASTRSFANPKANVSQLLYKPLCGAAEYRTYESQRRVLAAKQRQINDVYDRLIEARVNRLAPQMADYMVAARRVYEGKEEVEKAGAKLDLRVLRRWVDYLQDGAAGRPHLEAWANAPLARAREVALDYQNKYLAKLAGYNQQLAAWRERAAQADAEMKAAPSKPAIDAEEEPFFTDVTFGGPFKVSDSRRREGDVMNLDKDKERQRKLAEQMRRERLMTVTRDELLSDDDRRRVAELRAELEEMRKSAPPQPDMADAVEEDQPVEQRVFIRGDYNNPGEVAPKKFPAVLARPDDPQVKQGSGRLEFAEWLTRPGHPLTARVFVNRAWAWHFGEGLVRTPDNFGQTGERPTHPELLDYLAASFVANGWSVKQLHREIMLSSTYRMSSTASDESYKADPENRLLSRFQRRRLEVEEIRDALLATDGSIDFTMGGTLQTGFGTDGENSEGRLSLNPEAVLRRTVYLPLRRANLPTLLNLFDFGDATTVNGKRVITTVAPQALFSMNSEFVAARARNLALALLEDTDCTDADRVNRLYLRTVNRPPDSAERDAAQSYLAAYGVKFPKKAEPEAWQSLARVLLASNEFIYVE
jgi:hypothetical protein